MSESRLLGPSERTHCGHPGTSVVKIFDKKSLRNARDRMPHCTSVVCVASKSVDEWFASSRQISEAFEEMTHQATAVFV
jgi:hypothetical protein